MIELKRQMDKEISIQKAKEMVPALTNNIPASGMSLKYETINTLDIVQEFINLGWVITKASTDSGYKHIYDDKYRTHFITLQNPKLKSPVDNTFYEIIISNSYNGKSRFQVQLGLYRLVCANGMIAFTDVVQPITVKHIGEGARVVVDKVMETILYQMQIVETQTQKWNNTKLNDKQINQLAGKILKARMGKDFKPHKEQIKQITNIQRDEDKDNNVWEVFNRIQENVIQGNFEFRKSKRGPKGFFVTKTIQARGMEKPTVLKRFNEKIWELTNKIVEEVK